MSGKLINSFTAAKAVEIAGQAEVINNIAIEASERATKVADFLEELTQKTEEDDDVLSM